MPTTEQERLDWEVLKLKYECRPFYKNLDRVGSLAITVLAIAAFFYQRQQSTLEYQMASIQAEKASLDAARAVHEKEEAEKSRDAYNQKISELQAKLDDLQKTFDSKRQQMASLNDKVNESLTHLPKTQTTEALRDDLKSLNTQQTALDQKWRLQVEQVQQLKPLMKK